MKIRQATSKDADAILHLINLHAEMGQMLFRTREDVCAHIRDFLVAEKDGRVAAACGLSFGPGSLVEIRSLAVHPEYYRQGIGTALYEEMPYSPQGQPLASTLADYILPGPTEVPKIRIYHTETPSPYTTHGQKGVGEGGAIAPHAAIGNAINDALKPLGAEVGETPMTPHRILDAIQAAKAKAAAQ